MQLNLHKTLYAASYRQVFEQEKLQDDIEMPATNDPQVLVRGSYKVGASKKELAASTQEPTTQKYTQEKIIERYGAVL